MMQGGKISFWRPFGARSTKKCKFEGTIVQAPKLICFINDDSNDVGQVHFGVVWLVKLAEPNVTNQRRTGNR